MRSLTLFILLLPLLAGAKEGVWFNTGVNNRDITFSPDGNVMLTTVMAPKNLHSIIVMSVREGDEWSPLEAAPFSGEFPDIEPAFTPDGEFLYFASKRPGTAGEQVSWDIWRVSFSDGHWGVPENLGSPVNSFGNEFYPSITRDGVLYFTATREGGLGKEDLYRATPNEQGNYTSIENVGPPVNSEAYEFNAFIAEDESYLIFGSQGRASDIGGGDLYISFRKDDEFGEPALLPAPINTTKLDYCPMVYDGRFYFTSELPATDMPSSMAEMLNWYQSPGNGFGDIYSVNMEELLQQLSEL